MGLIAWYKLDGNANEEFNRFTGSQSGTVTYPNGKINQSAFLNTGRIDTNIPDSMLIGDMSFSVWFKKTTSDWSMSIGIAGTRRSTRGWMLYRNSGDTAGFFRWYNHYRTTSNTITSYYAWPGIFNLTHDRWYHIVCTRSADGSSTVYVDGNRVVNLSPPSNFDSWVVSEANLAIAGGQGSGSTSWNGRTMELDDFKLFDHVLSQKEVKLLSQAKVFHYKFDDPYEEPTENLFQNPFLRPGPDSNYWYWGTSVDLSGEYPVLINTNTGNRRGIVFDLKNIAIGDTITKTVWFRFKSGNTSFTSSTTDFSNVSRLLNGSTVGTTINYDQRSSWNIYSITGTATSTSPRMRFYTLGDAEIEIKQMQYEKKPSATPFTPTIREGLVFDSSGYLNNGTINLTSSPVFTTGKIGSGSVKFNGSQHLLSLNPKYETGDSFSISAWFKTTSSSDGRIIEGRDGNKTGSPLIALITNHASNGGISLLVRGQNGARRDINVLGNYNNGEWHHVAAVTNNGNTFLYINGSLEGQNTSGVDMRIDLTNTPMAIGARNLEGNISAFFTGDIDDLRIYNTPLSLEEVKSLYESRASIDNQGNNYAQEIDTSGTIVAFTQTGTHTWNKPADANFAEILVVGGGGGGGSKSKGTSGGTAGGAGGGAGGLIYAQIPLNKSTYNITVGAGGAGGGIPDGGGSTQNGFNGQNSVFDGWTAFGGGGGARNGSVVGNNGGSGGGSSSTLTTSSGIEGQGFGGGSGNSGTSFPRGGGGGAGEPGGEGISGVSAGNGGDGLYFGDIFGDNFGDQGWFAGGGGGSWRAGTNITGAAKGGKGGGTNGGIQNNTQIGEFFGSNDAMPPAMANTGGGGGGQGGNSVNLLGHASSGGSGIVLIKYYSGSFNSQGIASFSEISEVGIVRKNIGLWNLNSNSLDFSGLKNNGSDTNVNYTNGFNQLAANFNGSNSRIVVSNYRPLQGSPEFTFSFMSRIFSNSSTGYICWANNIFLFEVQTNGSYRIRFNLDGDWRSTYNMTYPLNEWHHVAITWDGTNTFIYRNGEKLVSSTADSSRNSFSNGNTLEFGARDSSQVLNGQMQRIKIHEVALSEQEISADYKHAMELNKTQILKNGTLIINGEFSEVD